MPRITAASVAEHVAEQERAVFTAAIDLFIERGYDAVTLADIAARIGLARNSLYRYFPDKAHILLRWFDQELPVQVEQATRVLAAPGRPVERIVAWAHDQLDYASRPEHALIAQIGALVPNLDADAREQLRNAHRQLLLPLNAALAEAGIPESEQALVADLLQGLILAAARQPEPRTEAARGYLDDAIEGLLGSRRELAGR